MEIERMDNATLERFLEDSDTKAADSAKGKEKAGAIAATLKELRSERFRLEQDLTKASAVFEAKRMEDRLAKRESTNPAEEFKKKIDAMDLDIRIFEAGEIKQAAENEKLKAAAQEVERNFFSVAYSEYAERRRALLLAESEFLETLWYLTCLGAGQSHIFVEGFSNPVFGVKPTIRLTIETDPPPTLDAAGLKAWREALKAKIRASSDVAEGDKGTRNITTPMTQGALS